uniref:Exocyst complex component Sec3 PIP2-binding N-terminal domain-containing protein n=1 Tax=Plectus sambesii TaxID=2011161 RepID=A0A914X136_9BILA
MAAIRASLQRELFQPDDERLMAVINVVKSGKKKKKDSTFLCLAVTTNQPITVRLYQVKSDKGDVFKKKSTWLLRQVRQVNGINPRKQTGEFELLIDKVFRWTATNVAEKDPFIKQLWKLSNRYLPVQKPEFVNVPIPEEEFSAEPTLTIVPGEDDSNGQPEDSLADYQPVSAKEEADFRRLLTRCNMTIGQADAFADQLSRELSVLDGANIQAIMGSEQAVLDLMNLIDASLEEADRLEAELVGFDQLLSHVRENVEMMEEKDSLSHVETNNRKKLMEHLRLMVAALELSQEDEKVLMEGRLADPASINRCTRAAQELQRCLQPKVPAGMNHMKAYKEQLARCQQLSDKFAEKFIAHITALFQNLIELREELPSGQWHNLALPKQSQRQHALLPFAELVMWIKLARPEVYKVAIDRYITYTKELYKRDLEQFFEQLKVELTQIGADRRSSAGGQSRIIHERSGSAGGLDLGASDHDSFVKLIETMLCEIEPVVSSEQKFCVRFFHISSDIMATLDTQSTGSADSGGSGHPVRHLEKQFNEQVRNILNQLFRPLDAHLRDFVENCEKINPVAVMILLVRLSKKVLSVQDAGSYIAVILGTLVVLVKRRFDLFMEQQVQSLSDVRLPKKTRVGVLDTLRRFRAVAMEAEGAFKDSERRADVDRWYPQLVNAVCQGIEKAAVDPHSKSPAAVVRFENYHQLYSDVSALKIACLENARKNIRKAYQDSMASYVKEYMGRPLERLQTYFDQVERCIQQGMKAEEVGYQQQFSKQELRRVISSYPGKEVKKGLDQLYRKVEKHLMDGSPLLQVVWRDMQDEFLQQLKHYDQLMGACYPNSKTDLEFSIQDVLQYFSEIAQQH